MSQEVWKVNPADPGKLPEVPVTLPAGQKAVGVIISDGRMASARKCVAVSIGSDTVTIPPADAAEPVVPSPAALTLTVNGTLSTANPAVLWIDKAGVCYGAYTTLLYKSIDGGATWGSNGSIANFSGEGKIIAVRILDSGEALVSTDINGATPSKLWKSAGFAANPATATWSVVLARPETITAFIDRGLSVDGQYVLCSAYGYPGYGNSRQVYLSSDYGSTFAQVFDTYTYCPNPSVSHVHGCSLDLVGGLIWCYTGDSVNRGVWCASINTPTAWVKVWADQPTTGYPMRNGVLFGTDNPDPNGVVRIRRGSWARETAYGLPTSNVVDGSTVFCRGRTGDALYMSFVPISGQGDHGYVFGTVDGETVSMLYECPAGDSVRRVVGPTDTGLLHFVVTRGGTSTEETATAPAPVWGAASSLRNLTPLKKSYDTHTALSLPGVWYAGRGSPASAKAGSNEGAYETMLFDPAASETAICPISVPPGADFVDVDLWWTNGGAGSGNVVWTLYQARAFVDGVALNVSDFNDPVAVIVAAPAQHVLKKTRIRTRLPTFGASVLRLALNRNGTDVADTLDANDAAAVAIVATRAL